MEPAKFGGFGNGDPTLFEHPLQFVFIFVKHCQYFLSKMVFSKFLKVMSECKPLFFTLEQNLGISLRTIFKKESTVFEIPSTKVTAYLSSGQYLGPETSPKIN